MGFGISIRLDRRHNFVEELHLKSQEMVLEFMEMVSVGQNYGGVDFRFFYLDISNISEPEFLKTLISRIVNIWDLGF